MLAHTPSVWTLQCIIFVLLFLIGIIIPNLAKLNMALPKLRQYIALILARPYWLQKKEGGGGKKNGFPPLFFINVGLLSKKQGHIHDF